MGDKKIEEIKKTLIIEQERLRILKALKDQTTKVIFNSPIKMTRLIIKIINNQ